MKASRFFVIGTAVWSSLLMGLNTGCASGGFKLTRQYAGFVNKQDLIIRIILYILTMVVFAVTVLIDAVIFNTMDFWEGRVSQGTFQFKEGEKTFVAEHSFQDGGKLRQSRITITENEKVQEILLKETASGTIEVFENGAFKVAVSEPGHVDILKLARL